VLPDETRADTFSSFVVDREEHLRIALTARFGPDLGREAAADALAYGWEHWDRISAMENPAGYLYRVGMNAARRSRRRPAVVMPEVSIETPWVEPGLPKALQSLSPQQRTVVALVYGLDWTMAEVAELLDISKASVQKHADRGMSRLRRTLGVSA